MHLSYQTVLISAIPCSWETGVLRPSFSALICSMVELYAGGYIAVSNLNHVEDSTPIAYEIGEAI